ncbi:queuosine precursor transporter [Paenibacillus septentrionalis]|uniref:Probable queuosine precursor transporter n=1 Tax=Paenibacillus septentrionalis TaxID=429342 RepID=A0ABW1VAC9_9BACL
MFNLGWGIFFIAVNFALFLICYRMFGRIGLYAWIGFATVIANIQVTKTIELSIASVGIIMTLGNTIYTTISMSTDMLNEKFGSQEARRAVWFGFFTLIASTIMMQMVLAFEPQETDFAHDSLQTIFGLMPRLAAGSLLAYFISQFLDVRVYGYLRKKFGARNQFWIRTNVSTGFSQLIDSLVFCTIAFAGLYTLGEWLQIVFTTYIFKFIISVLSTPVLYWARSFKLKEEQLQEQSR